MLAIFTHQNHLPVMLVVALLVSWPFISRGEVASPSASKKTTRPTPASTSQPTMRSARDTSGGCPAEFRDCRGDGSGPVGDGGGGGGGTLGQVDCGPNGEFWVPGTGCHPDSRCFQDLDNYRNALTILEVAKECVSKGGAWTPEADSNGQPGGIECNIGGGRVSTRLPTTEACLGRVMEGSGVGTRKEILIGTPTRPRSTTTPPPRNSPSETREEVQDSRKDRIDRRVDPKGKRQNPNQ